MCIFLSVRSKVVVLVVDHVNSPRFEVLMINLHELYLNSVFVSKIRVSGSAYREDTHGNFGSGYF